jgi:RNA-directed DNA polymerase
LQEPALAKAGDALREVDRLLREGFTWVVDADLQGYFDSIPHDRMMALVAGSISDGAILSLIEGFLQQDIMKDMARWRPVLAKAGTETPQGRSSRRCGPTSICTRSTS